MPEKIDISKWSLTTQLQEEEELKELLADGPKLDKDISFRLERAGVVLFRRGEISVTKTEAGLLVALTPTHMSRRFEAENRAKNAPAKRRLKAFLKEYEALKAKYQVRLHISEWAYFATGGFKEEDSFASEDQWDDEQPPIS